MHWAYSSGEQRTPKLSAGYEIIFLFSSGIIDKTQEGEGKRKRVRKRTLQQARINYKQWQTVSPKIKSNTVYNSLQLPMSKSNQV